MGLDAEVVGLVEERRAAGRTSTAGLYVRTAVRHFFTGAERRRAPLTLELPGEPPLPGLFLGIVANTSPWTYVGARPVNPTPQASFDTGLDLFALTSLGTVRTLRHSRQLLAASAPGPSGKDVVTLHDVSQFTLSSDEPVACQVDGDAVGERSAVTFRAIERALRVIA
jgi:diacylglycerol kinase family enzyme